MPGGMAETRRGGLLKQHVTVLGVAMTCYTVTYGCNVCLSMCSGVHIPDNQMNYTITYSRYKCVTICLSNTHPALLWFRFNGLLHCDCGNGPRMQRDISYSIFFCLCYFIVSVINSKSNKSERLSPSCSLLPMFSFQ